MMDELRMYKVTFVEHKATTTEEVDLTNRVAIESDIVDGKSVIKSITIFANTKEESIVTAQDIVNFHKKISLPKA